MLDWEMVAFQEAGDNIKELGVCVLRSKTGGHVERDAVLPLTGKKTKFPNLRR